MAAEVEELSGRATVLLRGSPGDPSHRLLSQIDVAHAVQRGPVLICRTGASEWWYSGPAHEVALAIGELDLSGATTVTDLTHDRAAILVSGPDARERLCRLTDFDLRDGNLPDRTLAVPTLAGEPCWLLRNDVAGQPAFLVSVERSYAAALLELLSGSGQPADRA